MFPFQQVSVIQYFSHEIKFLEEFFFFRLITSFLIYSAKLSLAQGCNKDVLPNGNQS